MGRKAITQSSYASGRKLVRNHPLFPTIVAIWFAALFGLVCLAVRTATLEALVLAMRLDTVLPAAAPPLGSTARLTIAVAMALVGGVIGLLIARRFAARAPADGAPAPAVQENFSLSIRPRDVHPDAPARRPISAHEELGEDAPPVRRPAEAEPALSAAISPAVLDMDSLRDALPSPIPAAPLVPEPVEEDVPEISVSRSQPATQSESPRESAPVAVSSETHFNLPAGEAAERIAFADLDELSHVELLERLAISLRARMERSAERREAGVATPAEGPRVGDGATATATDEALADGYNSLRGLTRSAPRTAASGPVGGEPVVIFPARGDRSESAPRDSADTEMALRNALAALQRMSGAA